MKRDLLSIVLQWSTSGLTQKEFCKKHKLGYNQLQYWLRRSKKPSNLSQGFIELVPEQTNSTAHSMELHFANGCRLLFFNTPEASFIKSLTS
jgi:hypothetical protein